MEKLIPHFSPARRAGSLVFVSGQMPFGDDGRILVGDVAAQTQRCIVNIEAVLVGQGLSRAHIVKTTVWLTRTEDFVAFDRAYAACFSGLPPARSTVRADLMVEGALVEIEAVAAVS